MLKPRTTGKFSSALVEFYKNYFYFCHFFSNIMIFAESFTCCLSSLLTVICNKHIKLWRNVFCSFWFCYRYIVSIFVGNSYYIFFALLAGSEALHAVLFKNDSHLQFVFLIVNILQVFFKRNIYNWQNITAFHSITV